jgi:hypothetical protein
MAFFRVDPLPQIPVYHQWGEEGLVLIVSWIDGDLIIGSKKAVEKAKKEFLQRFDSEDGGDLEEYMGCRRLKRQQTP